MWIRNICLAAVLAAYPYSICAAPIPKAADTPSPYFPVQIGTKWVYQQGDAELVETLTKVEKTESGGSYRITISQHDDDTGRLANTFLVSPQGVFRTHTGLTKHESPICLIKLPAKKGDAWDWPESVLFNPLLNEVGKLTVMGEEQIVVPAGKFQAVRVEVIWSKPANRRFAFWYTSGIGLVKAISGKTELKLKEFSLGKAK